MSRRRCRPEIEGLETRLALSSLTSGPGGNMTRPTQIGTLPIFPGPPGPGTDQGTLAVLEAFSQSYLSRFGGRRYDPAFDLNHNGKIAMSDAKLLINSLPPVGPKIPLVVNVALAPKDRVHGHVPTTLGGVTHARFPKVVGHTSPGALVFTGAGTIDVKLTGPVIVADKNGNFSLTEEQVDGLNNLNFRAVDGYGQQSQFRAFPIYWLNFAKYEDAHPRQT